MPAYDLEEVGPNRFLVHTPRIKGLLKGEGEFEGRFFRLTTWRRDGPIARLRQRLVQVLTLAEQIEALPTLPDGIALPGAPLQRILPANERLSLFDSQTLRWEPAHSAGAAQVFLPYGAAVRRRKGRGPASYALVASQGRDVVLQPLSEEAALMRAYAQLPQGRLALLAGPRLPELDVPPSYRPILKRIAPPETNLSEQAIALLQQVFGRLGVAVVMPADG